MDLYKIFDEYSFLWTFLEFHFGFDVFGEQVVYFFVIDFDEATANEMCFGGVVLGDGDDLAEGAGNDASLFFIIGDAHHGVGLAASGLSIGEYCAIVAVEYVFDEGEGTLFIDVALECVWGENAVEGEAFWGLLHIFADQIYLIIFGIDFHNVDAA